MKYLKYLVSLFLFSVGFSQVVIGKKGEVLKNNNIVRVGDTIRPYDHIIVPHNGYVAFVVKNRGVEIRESGVYSYDYIVNLLDQKTTGNSLNKYTGYILNQSVAYGGGRTSGKTLGAVTRGSLLPTLLIPNNTLMYRDSVVLFWNKSKLQKEKTYYVFVYDRDGILVKKYSTRDTFITIKEPHVFVDSVYYFSVGLTDLSDKQYVNAVKVLFVSDSLYKELKVEEGLYKSYITKDDYISYINLISFYHSYHMYGYCKYYETLLDEVGIEY